MSVLLSRRFWAQTTERAVKTAAQFTLVFLGADAFNLLEIDFIGVAGYALAGALVSVLTSISSASVSRRDTPDLMREL